MKKIITTATIVLLTLTTANAEGMKCGAGKCGSAQISTLYHGVERYAITLRLDPQQRADITTLGNIQIKTPLGHFLLRRFAKLAYHEDPSVIKSERGLGVNFIYITPKERAPSTATKRRHRRRSTRSTFPKATS